MAEIKFGPHQAKEAREYLQSEGKLEQVCSSAIFGGSDFEIVIAANVIFNLKSNTK